jgi:hypothetical protein
MRENPEGRAADGVFFACLPDYWPFGISSGMGMSGGAATGSTCSVCGRDFGNAGNS